MTFRVGQKVVCVRDDWLPVSYAETKPVKSGIYTVRSFVICGNKTGIRLDEIVNRPDHYSSGFTEVSFCVSNFRPVVTTDISIFTDMLNPTRVDDRTRVLEGFRT